MFILNLSELPSSVGDMECSSRAITDIIVSCAFSVDAKDFDLLLRGWNFRETRTVVFSGRSFAMDAPIGPDFDAVVRYEIKPPSFKHGGVINLVANEDRTRVVANRSEE